VVFDPACSTQSLFVHPTVASHRAAAGNCHGIPAWGGDTASIVNSPVCCTQKYLTGAEVSYGALKESLRVSTVTSCMPESFLIWQSFIDTVVPPRDPNDEDEAEDEDDRDVEEDDQPAVIREPDEDE
jgi:hypothetical protein